MADKRGFTADGGDRLTVGSDFGNARLEIDVLRRGVIQDSVTVSAPVSGIALLSHLALAMDVLGWIPEGSGTFIVRMARTECDDDDSDPPEWLRRRVDQEAGTLGVQANAVEILAHAPLLWSGWEGHSHVALLRLPDGHHRWLVVDDVSRGAQTVTDMLRERLKVYEEAAIATRRLLAIAGRLGAETTWDSATNKGPQS